MEDLLWRKKSRQRGRYLILFLIRLAETLTVSLLPSVAGLIAVFITPKLHVMQTIELISLVIFAVANCVFWTRYVFHRANLREFFILNSIVYLLYVAISVFAYLSSDAYLYSILFSNMRGLEIFGYRTFESLYKTHFIMFGLMIATGIIARIVCFYRFKKALLEGVEKAEMEEKEVVPEQDNKVVEFLTVDEVNLELEREMQEAAEMIRLETESVSDKNWDSTMVQGDNGEIIETTPVDPENDIDSKDYVSEEYAREEMSVTLNYDVGSLWNTDMYRGKGETIDFEEYESENVGEDDENDGLWNTDMYRGKGNPIDFEEEPMPEIIDEDDGNDGLWNTDMYRGKGEPIDFEEEPIPEIIDEDDGNGGLWNTDMYRGKGEPIDFEEEPMPEIIGEDDENDGLWNTDMYRGKGEPIDFEEEPVPEIIGEDDENDGLWNTDMYRGRDESNGLEYNEEEEQYIEWDDEPYENEPLLEYDEPEEYLSAGMEDYDTESLWGDFTQGQ